MSNTEKKNEAVKMTFDADTGVATLLLEMEGRANKINETFGKGLADAIDRAVRLDGLKGMVLGTGPKDLLVGADIHPLLAARGPATCWAPCANRRSNTMPSPDFSASGPTPRRTCR